MSTILHIKEALSFYSNNDVSESGFISVMTKLLSLFPHLLHQICKLDICEEEASELVGKFGKEAKKSFAPIFPSHLKYVDVINDNVIETPIFDTYNDYRSSVERKCIIDYLLNIILSMPINKVNVTFVELGNEFVGDFFYKNINPKIYHNNPIIDEHSFREYLSQQKKRIVDVKKQYGNYFEYCLKNKAIPLPYEIMVISEDNTNWFKSYEKDLMTLNSQSKESGLFIIQVSKTEQRNHRNEEYDEYDIFSLNSKLEGRDLRACIKGMYDCTYMFNELRIDKKSIEEKYQEEKFLDVLNEYSRHNYKTTYTLPSELIYRDKTNSSNFEKLKKELYKSCKSYIKFKVLNTTISDLSRICTPLINCNNITNNANLLKYCLKYINEEAEREEEIAVLTQNFSDITENNYEKNTDVITVPVGRSSNINVDFRMDMVSHVHSFIIGQSGSGKSVFLHNIIGSSIMKYAPEDLQLYLLDFKLGGVEFNRYRGVKHIKSLLVDNSDQQITLEILRELHDKMIERGKKFREYGVNNLVEYNKINTNSKMPQILVIVDECHEMFKISEETPRAVSNEISEIVTKIAKEGRNQGVHLILATQTLSGAEINNEIINNISDHYLLKCASVDSERMVERSSEITSKLQTGQIYYYHVDKQVLFQAYYTDKENAELLIEKAKEKAKGHQSNGEFYFNGSQLFKLDSSIIYQEKKHLKYPCAYIGKNISINQNDVNITLRRDYSENILLFGLNDREQLTRTTMNVFLSILFNAQYYGMDFKFKVINCLFDEDNTFAEQLKMLEDKGCCEIIEGRKQRGAFLKQLADDITNETANNTILLILGQERFRELKMDVEIVDEPTDTNVDDAFGFVGFSNDCASSANVRTFKQALDVILDKGPEYGVHTIIQLDKPSNFLFNDYISPKMVYQKFKHLIMLKSEETASSLLHLNDNIHLEVLSKDTERLRAYYYSDESDAYILLTPYMQLNNDEIIDLLKLK